MEASLRGHSDSEWADFENELQSAMPKLRAFAYRLARNAADADDLVQDTLVRALKNRHQYIMGTNMRSWLFTIARNQFYTEKRRLWRNVPLDPEIAERTLTSDGDTAQQEASLDWDALLLQLLCVQSTQRDALIAVGYLGMGYEQAAHVFTCPIGTIKSRVSRARTELVKLLDEPPPDAGSLDLTVFRHATRGVPKSHPYYPIAAAYEELYCDFVPPERTTAQNALRSVPAKEKEMAEEAWDDLLASGALDESTSLADLMSSGFE